MTNSLYKQLFFHLHNNWQWYVAILCVIIYLLIIIFTFNTGYGWDESIYLLHTDIFSGRQSDFNEFNFRPILFSIVLMPFYNLSSNLIFLRIIMILFSIFILILLFFLLKKLFGSKIAILLVSFFCLSPIFVGTSQYILTDIIVLLFVVPGVYFAYKYFCESKRTDLLFSSIFFGFAFLTRFFYGSFLLLLLLFMLFKYRSIKQFIIDLFFAFVPFLVIIFPYLLFSKYLFGGFLTTLKVGQILVSFYDNPWYVYFSYFFEYWQLLFLAAIIGIYFLYKRKEDHKTRFFFAFLILFIIQLVYFCLTPHKEPMYAIPLAFDILFLAGFGITNWVNSYSAKTKKIIIKLCLIIILIIIIFALYFFATKYISFENNVSQNMLPINYLKDTNFVGTIYTNTDVPQYIYLFPNNKIVNIYWYNLNDKNYEGLFIDNGVLVTNIWAKPLDLNFLNGKISILKEFSPYVLYDVNVK